MTFLGYRQDFYSQNGEDGILAELVHRLGLDDPGEHWCVEFGAWDGKHLSNTFHLVETAGWNAVYIEGDADKYESLRLGVREHPRITTMLAMVGGAKGGGLALDDLLASTEIPRNYDMLSIDIDSSDLDAWVRHSDYRPRIVVIEVNSSIEPGILQWHSAGAPGSSFTSTVNVAAAKGYTLVCHTGNCIFVANELLDQVGLDELDRIYPERLFMWDWIQRGSRKACAEKRLWSRARVWMSLQKPAGDPH